MERVWGVTCEIDESVHVYHKKTPLTAAERSRSLEWFKLKANNNRANISLIYHMSDSIVANVTANKKKTMIKLGKNCKWNSLSVKDTNNNAYNFKQSERRPPQVHSCEVWLISVHRLGGDVVWI